MGTFTINYSSSICCAENPLSILGDQTPAGFKGEGRGERQGKGKGKEWERRGRERWVEGQAVEGKGKGREISPMVISKSRRRCTAWAE